MGDFSGGKGKNIHISSFAVSKPNQLHNLQSILSLVIPLCLDNSSGHCYNLYNDTTQGIVQIQKPYFDCVVCSCARHSTWIMPRGALTNQTCVYHIWTIGWNSNDLAKMICNLVLQ